MIVSHNQRFIFIHCRKVAGSSIKVSLAPCLGPDDIMIGSWHEALRSNTRLNKQARRTLLHPLAMKTWLTHRLAGNDSASAINEAIKTRYVHRGFANPPHASAAEIKRHFPDEWKRYFKFCIIRNPYDRLVSEYLWRTKNTNIKVSFRDYLKCLRGERFYPNLLAEGETHTWNMYTINNRVEVDYIGKYENMKSDLRKITEHLNLPRLTLSHVKETGRDRSYREYYGYKEREIADSLVANECVAHGYEF
ncbi:MAG: sulfotransferase family 2 domain-containing protein [Pseudomonadales bacterium]